MQEAAGLALRGVARGRSRPGDYMTSAAVWDDDRLREVIDRSGVFD